MSISIKYVSRRSEVMTWYWRMWRNRLWRAHLLVFVTVATFASIAMFDGLPQSYLAALEVLGIGLIPLAGFVLYPILKFKPQERTLTVDEEGLATTIGQMSKRIPWPEVASAQVVDKALIIQGRNHNAFIVPARAFSTDEAKEEFRIFVLKKVNSNIG